MSITWRVHLHITKRTTPVLFVCLFLINAKIKSSCSWVLPWSKPGISPCRHVTSPTNFVVVVHLISPLLHCITPFEFCWRFCWYFNNTNSLSSSEDDWLYRPILKSAFDLYWPLYQQASRFLKSYLGVTLIFSENVYTSWSLKTLVLSVSSSLVKFIIN